VEAVRSLGLAQHGVSGSDEVRALCGPWFETALRASSP
jgi:hypothetical protein